MRLEINRSPASLEAVTITKLAAGEERVPAMSLKVTQIMGREWVQQIVGGGTAVDQWWGHDGRPVIEDSQLKLGGQHVFEDHMVTLDANGTSLTAPACRVSKFVIEPLPQETARVTYQLFWVATPTDISEAYQMFGEHTVQVSITCNSPQGDIGLLEQRA